MDNAGGPAVHYSRLRPEWMSASLPDYRGVVPRHAAGEPLLFLGIGLWHC